MTLEIRLFGELSVLRDGGAVGLPASRKTRALLAYLAATPRSHLREKLCALLWEGPDDPRAALRWSLTKLRAVVDDPGRRRLVADREHVQLELTDCSVDLAMLRAAIPGCTPGGARRLPTETLRAVAPLLRGELLEGLELPECSRFVEWCRAERALARGVGAAVLATLVDRLAEAGGDETYEALEHARCWAQLDPLDEAAHAAVGRVLELARPLSAPAGSS